MPGSIVEVANLLLVLHHTGRLAFFLILQSNVILYGLKVLPMLRWKARRQAKDIGEGGTTHVINTLQVPITLITDGKYIKS